MPQRPRRRPPQSLDATLCGRGGTHEACNSWGSCRVAADRDLVKSFLRDRDEQLFRELYRRHTPLLFRLARRLLAGEPRPSLSAEDATQECWLRAVRSLDGFEWRSALSTWLAGIIVRVCAEARRTTATVFGIDEQLETLLPPAVDAAVLDRADIEKLLGMLAPGYRAAVILHDIEGFTHEEIAAALGISPGTAKSQLARGRRALREAVGTPPKERSSAS
jgi:RNA polymerase sigma factor (sigma-70 family)